MYNPTIAVIIQPNSASNHDENPILKEGFNNVSEPAAITDVKPIADRPVEKLDRNIAEGNLRLQFDLQLIPSLSSYGILSSVPRGEITSELKFSGDGILQNPDDLVKAIDNSFNRLSIDYSSLSTKKSKMKEEDEALQAICQHIMMLAQTDPIQASLMSHQVALCGWTGREINHLRILGLPVKGLRARGLLGGGLLEDLAIEASKGGIQLLRDGNAKEMGDSREAQVIPAKIQLPNGSWEEGTHSGGRILSEPTCKCLCLCPKYSLLASGDGEFISNQVTYRGNFRNNLFHDNTGNTEYFIANHLRYKGGFEKGKRSGVGNLERYDPHPKKFYLYYQGYWEHDTPSYGTYYSPHGEEIAVVEQGIISRAASTPFHLSKVITSSPSHLSQVAISSPSILRPEQHSQEIHLTVHRIFPTNIPVTPREKVFPTTTPPPGGMPVNAAAVPSSPDDLPSFDDIFSESKNSDGKSPLQLGPSIPLENNLLLNQKLNNPHMQLTLDQSVTLLTDCIHYGLIEARKAKTQDLLVFIGSTGAGKSTMVNYLAGCTLQRKSSKELGIIGLDKVVVVLPKTDGGFLDEIMTIDHSKHSTTFMPQIKSDVQQKITYCDCPGFSDNRGTEINIANAVNIKNSLHQARSVRVIILINYHSLKDNRGKGLSEMLEISCNLFGNAQNLIHHKDSILIGITKTPLDMSLLDLKEWIVESQLPAMQALADRLFTFDPLEVPLEGGWSRETVLGQIHALIPIKRPQKIFSAVLTYSDETALIRIGEGINSSIQKALEIGDFQEAAKLLGRLQQLNVVDHITAERLLAQNLRGIEQQFREWMSQFKAECHFEQFLEAQAILLRLSQAVQHFDTELQKSVALDELRKYYQSFLSRKEQAEQKERTYQEQLRQENLRVEEFIALLDEQKKNTEKRLQLQEQDFKIMRQETERSIKETSQSYEAMKRELKQEMERRLKRKEEELQTTQAQGSQEAQHHVEQEKEKLRSDYTLQLKKMEEEKQLFLERQQIEKEKQGQHLQKERAALETKLNELEGQKIRQIKIQEERDVLRVKLLQGISMEAPLGNRKTNVQLDEKSNWHSISELKGHEKCVDCMARIADDLIVSGSEDKTLRIWRLGAPGLVQAKCLHVLKGHENRILCVARITNDLIVSGSGDYTPRIWQVSIGKCLQILKGHESSIDCVSRITDDLVVSGSYDHTLRIWQVSTGKCLQILKGHEHTVGYVARITDDLIVSGSRDDTIRIWQVSTGECLRILKDHGDRVTCVARITDDLIVSGSWDSTLRIWQVSTGKCFQILKEHRDRVTCVARITDDLIVSGSWDSTPRIWQVSTGKCLQVLKGHEKCVWCVARIADDLIVSGSFDNSLRIWQVSTGKCLQKLEGHESPVYCVSRIIDNLIVSGSEDNTLRIWHSSSSI